MALKQKKGKRRKLLAPSLFLIVGLGNPGSQHDLNRHNIGFLAIDTIANVHSFPAFKSKFSAKVSEGKIGTHRVILCKPQTYMNLSGRSVAEICKFYKIPATQVYVIHDDLDLEPGRLKVKLGGGSGGHNGLKSLDQHLTPNYWRIRLGIGHPGFKEGVSNYVLSNFHKDDEEWLTDLLGLIAKNTPYLFQDEPAAWLNRFQRK